MTKQNLLYTPGAQLLKNRNKDKTKIRLKNNKSR